MFQYSRRKKVTMYRLLLYMGFHSNTAFSTGKISAFETFAVRWFFKLHFQRGQFFASQSHAIWIVTVSQSYDPLSQKCFTAAITFLQIYR